MVTKIPRWTFEKFPDADETLTTQMKSVGEAMSIGRTFKESLQKGDPARWMSKRLRATGSIRNDKWLAAMRAVESGQLVLDVMGGPGEGREEGRNGETKGGKEASPTGLRRMGMRLNGRLNGRKLTRKLSVPSQAVLLHPVCVQDGVDG